VELPSASRALKDRLPHLFGVGAILLLDRISKVAIQGAFGPGDGRTVVAGFFDIVYVQNTGVAFGVLSGGTSSARVALLSGFAIVASLAVVFYSIRSPITDRVLQIGLMLILGGALGNLYDRLNYGYVVDFLYFHAGPYYWPAFNVADTCISVGVASLLVVVIHDEIRARA
jgi:signal peptidase II